jgi:hypothetical protein
VDPTQYVWLARRCRITYGCLFFGTCCSATSWVGRHVLDTPHSTPLRRIGKAYYSADCAFTYLLEFVGDFSGSSTCWRLCRTIFCGPVPPPCYLIIGQHHTHNPGHRSLHSQIYTLRTCNDVSRWGQCVGRPSRRRRFRRATSCFLSRRLS